MNKFAAEDKAGCCIIYQQWIQYRPVLVHIRILTSIENVYSFSVICLVFLFINSDIHLVEETGGREITLVLLSVLVIYLTKMYLK